MSVPVKVRLGMVNTFCTKEIQVVHFLGETQRRTRFVFPIVIGGIRPAGCPADHKSRGLSQKVVSTVFAKNDLSTDSESAWPNA